jgi:hypothetical protein
MHIRNQLQPIVCVHLLVTIRETLLSVQVEVNFRIGSSKKKEKTYAVKLVLKIRMEEDGIKSQLTSL